ncbi:hypothetical protein NDU88_002614 [Pleurodeles waltl]|uniref:Uncharacterized protein n=1 Tax=Pleurodeles waltl TaxID=8319 RepID=A0AAV7MPB4_PLEWA|nr:hypothetical protein NDU88_002614 [Pleurodeles waltl]
MHQPAATELPAAGGPTPVTVSAQQLPRHSHRCSPRGRIPEAEVNPSSLISTACYPRSDPTTEGAPSWGVQITTYSLQQLPPIHRLRGQDPNLWTLQAPPASQLISIGPPILARPGPSLRAERETLTKAKATLSGGTNHNRPVHTCLLLAAETRSAGTGTQCRPRSPRGRSPTQPLNRHQEGEHTAHLPPSAATPANSAANRAGPPGRTAHLPARHDP